MVTLEHEQLVVIISEGFATCYSSQKVPAELTRVSQPVSETSESSQGIVASIPITGALLSTLMGLACLL